jgi:hypothetical protein
MDDIELLPEWASQAITDGSYRHIRAALPTRDGRRTGNATVAGFIHKHGHDLIVVITDAGNILRLTDNEIRELFYPPQWVMEKFLDAHLMALTLEGHAGKGKNDYS